MGMLESERANRGPKQVQGQTLCCGGEWPSQKLQQGIGAPGQTLASLRTRQTARDRGDG